MRRDGQGSTQTNFKEFGLCLLEKKTMVFPVVMYRCENWTIKRAKRPGTDAFELLEKTFESPLDCKEIKPVNPKGSQP